MFIGLSLRAGAASASAVLDDPSDMAFSGWWRSDFSGAPWEGEASAGTSGGENLLPSAFGSPTIGTPITGRDVANFDGVDDNMVSDSTINAFLSNTEWSSAVVFYADTAEADPGETIRRRVPAIWDDNATTVVGLHFHTGGLTLAIVNGGTLKELTTPCSVGALHRVLYGWDGSSLWMRLDGAAAVTVSATGALTLPGAKLRLGKNYQSKLFDGRIGELIFAKETWDAAEIARVDAYLEARWAEPNTEAIGSISALAQETCGATPALTAVAATLLPVANATEVDVVVRGFSANATAATGGLAASWYVEYGATSSYGTSTTPRALPGKLSAYYREEFAAGTSGWLGSINENQLTHRTDVGQYVRFTDLSGADDDTNHMSGIGIVHLPIFGYIGSYDPGDAPLMLLGGGRPDLRDARVRLRARGNPLTRNGAGLMTWIQADEDTTLEVPPADRRVNWAHTGSTVKLAGASQWADFEWALTNSTHEWTYAGRNNSAPVHRYWYGELDKALSNVNVDIFPLMLVDIDQNAEPSGSVDFDNLQITYRNHNCLAVSNGGTLDSWPVGGSDAATLTDGWRNGSGHEWESAASPSAPQVFVYSLANPVTVDVVQIHNSVAYPSEDVEVEVSEDGASWTSLGTFTLPQSSIYGSNFVFHREYATGVGTEFVPLHADPISYVRVSILSGYQATKWGLGAVEVFGSGSVELTDSSIPYHLNQDVEVAAGTYHYRVVLTTTDGVVYGSDQTVTVV